MKEINLGSVDFSPEMRLLLCCCRDGSGEEIKTGIQTVLSSNEIDWKAFLKLVLYHRVLPTVYLNFQAHAAEWMPPEITEALNRHFQYQKMRSLKLTAETIRLVKLLEENSIDVISIKGLALAKQLYGDIILRHPGDIDLLVDEQDIDRIDWLISQKGYDIQYKEHKEIFSSSHYRKAFMKSIHHVNYYNGTERIRIEFHYRFFSNPHLFPYDKRETRANLQFFYYSGTMFRLLSPIDNSLYLFAHGSQHRWFRLKWMLDIARLSASPFPGMDWDRLFARSRGLGLERTVAQGLLAAGVLFDSPLPPGFSELPVNRSIVARLVSKALLEINKPIDKISKDRHFPRLRKKFYLAKLKRGLRYKMFHFGDIFNRDANRKVLKLPDGLFPLYYLLNPFLWIYRKFIAGRKRKRK